MLAPSWQILYPKVLELSLRSVGSSMSLCPMLILELSLSSSLTASEQGSLMTTGELLNVSTLDPLLPTFLITTLCLCALSVITYYSLVVAWEVFWASQWSPSLLDPSTEVVLTVWGECQETRTLVIFFPSIPSLADTLPSYFLLWFPYTQPNKPLIPIPPCLLWPVS